MIEKSIIKSKHFLLVFILTALSLLLYNRISGAIFLLLGPIIWVTIYVDTKKTSSSEYTFIKMLMLSIPLSFTSVVNGSYGDIPLSWFNIFIFFLALVTILKRLKNNRLKFNYLSIFALFMMFISLLPLLVASSFSDGLKQYLNISMVFLVVILGSLIKEKLTLEENENLLSYYILGTYIAAIGVIIQFIFINFVNEGVGYYSEFGVNRKAYAFLFSDFSFLSLYLASGATMVFLKGVNYYKSTFRWGFLIIILLIASLITSARTGIAAFLMVLVVYSLGRLLVLLSKGSVKSILLLLFNGVILAGSYFVLNRVRIGDLSGDSGRFDINITAFEVFMQNPFLGLGFGVSSYAQSIGTIPHNILFQLLAQGGIVFMLPLIIFLFVIAVISYKKNKVLFGGYVTILFGALFIPDIFNSRFLTGIILLISVYSSMNKIKEKM